MANTINYAEKWSEMILDIITQNTLSAPYITSNVEWMGAKTFHFTQMSLSGYKNHTRAGGWNSGDVTQTDNSYTVTHDRDIEFLVDRADQDESGGTATPGNVTTVFTQTQQAPETDAYFFSKVATEAIANTDYTTFDATAIASFDKTNVYGKLKTAMTKGKLRLYKQRGTLLMYVNSTVMDLLEQSADLQRKIEVDTVTEGGASIETRITSIDGVPIIEVIDDERFYTSFDYTDGFTAAVGSFSINFLLASQETVKTVPKISSIYNFAPGGHTKGDGFLYQNRSFWDTFIFPNGKDNKIDSIYVSRDTVAVT
jgi:hypothetical protein